MITAAFRRFREVGLDDRAFHLVWRFAGGDVRDEFWVEIFKVVDPARGARGDLREDTAFGDTVQEFLALFHDGEVSREVGVKDAVEAHSVESSDHLAGSVLFANLMSEFFGDGGADRWSGLDDNVFARLEGSIDFVDFAVLGEGAGWADLNALAAL